MKPELELIPGGDPVRQQASRWFARLHADDASEQDRQQWRRWMDMDPRHGAAYARLESLWSTMGEASHTAEIATRLHAVRASHRTRHATGAQHWWGAMVAAVTLCALGIMWLLHAQRVPEEHYATVVAEQRQLVLSDGTRVDLDADSVLRVAYSRSERRITLDRGRAWFDVARDPQRPLVVDTGHGHVEAIGTAFAIDRRLANATISLTEGKVLLSPMPTETGTGWDPVPLEAGHLALIDRQQPPRISPLDVSMALAWRDGWLVFDDQPLAEALAEFNRYNRRPLLLADTGLATQHVSGVFRSDDMRAFAGAIGARYGLDLDESDPTRLLLVPSTAK
jgi:transmembrane sensor